MSHRYCLIGIALLYKSDDDMTLNTPGMIQVALLVFHEAFTFCIVVGASLIVIAVTWVVSGNTIIAGFKRRVTF